MKHKMSITMDEETVLAVMGKLKSGRFRNKSHVIEYAVKKLMDDDALNEDALKKLMDGENDR
ncbi:MAG: hypothetical protein Q8O89_03755 [Nanoarchaeota archaeon]|nr:hypothetical protein [Nanoarchaeota archaeon]